MDTIPHPDKSKKKDDTKPTTAFLPPGWEGLPLPGDELEVVRPERKRRGEIWKVTEIQKNGTMVLVPVRNVKRLGK